MSTMHHFDPTKLEQYEKEKRSFLGRDIEKWCIENKDSDDFESRFLASSLYKSFYHYKETKPHHRQYYYIILNQSFKPYLLRDTVVCPIIRLCDKKNISYNDMKNIILEVREKTKYIMKNNNEYDVKECKYILNLLNIRINHILAGKINKNQILNKNKYNNLSKYMKIQLYSVHTDALIDLSNLYQK